MFKFNKKSAISDDRAIFANNVCTLLVQKNNNDIDKSVKELQPIYDKFEENVRNVYELIDREIPLFALYDLERFGADNYDMTKKEYSAAIERTKTACISYYCN